jgi:hypothetical protein
VRLDRDEADFLRIVHPRRRHLHLHEIAGAVHRVAPPVRGNEAARRRRRDERPGDVLGRHAALPCSFTVDRHVDRRVVHRLGVLQVGQTGDLAQLKGDLAGVGDVVGEVRAADRDLDRRRGSEAHDLVDDVASLQRQP